MPEYRLRRIHRWFLLVLKWFAGFLEAAEEWAPLSREATALAHAWLDTHERTLISVLIARAGHRIRQNGKCLGRRRHHHRRRAFIGGAVRRALRAKDLRDRIARLSQNIDALVDIVYRRMPRGFTRSEPRRTRYQKRDCARARAGLSPVIAGDTS